MSEAAASAIYDDTTDVHRHWNSLLRPFRSPNVLLLSGGLLLPNLLSWATLRSHAARHRPAAAHCGHRILRKPRDPGASYSIRANDRAVPWPARLRHRTNDIVDVRPGTHRTGDRYRPCTPRALLCLADVPHADRHHDGDDGGGAGVPEPAQHAHARQHPYPVLHGARLWHAGLFEQRLSALQLWLFPIGRNKPVESASEVSGFKVAAGAHGNNVVVVIVDSLATVIGAQLGVSRPTHRQMAWSMVSCLSGCSRGVRVVRG